MESRWNADDFPITNGVKGLDDASPLALTAAELPRRGRFRLSRTLVDPATRLVKGPGGETAIEPRVMQVLLALAEARGEVVTRATLISRCWGGQIVGDDAINRAVGEVRRLARTTGGGGFAVETISRTGYRLTGATMAPERLPPPSAPVDEEAARIPGRRRALAAGAAVVAGGMAAGAWWLWGDQKSRRAQDLATQARIAFENDKPADAGNAVALLREALALDPRNPALWGQLALAWRATADFAPPASVGSAVEACEQAAARALALDPKQPDARVALLELGPSFGVWLDVERKLRAVLNDAPGHVEATSYLALTLQAVGRSGEMSVLVDDLAARRPLAPAFQFRRTYALWCRGRLDEAYRNADRAIEIWPRHPGVWMSRIWLTAFTGRADAALSQVDDQEHGPGFIGGSAAALLRLSLQAIQSREPRLVERATAANLKDGMTGHGAAVSAVMILTALGRLDEAFTVAFAYLSRQGPRLAALHPSAGQPQVRDEQHRKTMMLFVPVCAPMLAHPRFAELSRACGLADYWRQSGHGPDFLHGRTVA